MAEYSIFIFIVRKYGHIFHAVHYGTTEGDAKAELIQYLEKSGWKGIESIHALRRYDCNDGSKWDSEPLTILGRDI